MNPIFATDSYKSSHYLQDPPGTTGKFSYIEARSGDYTVFFGLQAILRKYLAKPITITDVYQAKDFFEKHGLPFNIEGWSRIVTRHGGHIPVEIRAVAEGSVVPTGNVLVTVETTDPELPWVASYIETLLLRVWYPTTVATRSFKAKQVIVDAMLRTCDTLDGLPFKLHDFGARGVSSGESAELGGMAHLVNFMGSDTVEGIVAAMEYYGRGVDGNEPPAYSIPAAEHSTITAWGREGEEDAYRNMLQKFGSKGKILAVVSDSYDIYKACNELWGDKLRQEVIDSGATVVIRPDSGDPSTVVLQVADILAKRFGTVKNGKGYHVLNNVRIIQGDGLNDEDDIKDILVNLMAAGFSAENVAFGMGGGLLQKCNRDTFGFAMKCSAANINGEWRDVYKDPITSSGKRSKKGRLTLVKDADGKYFTLSERDALKMFSEQGWEDKGALVALKTVYLNGMILGRANLDEVRKRTGLWNEE